MAAESVPVPVTDSPAETARKCAGLVAAAVYVTSVVLANYLTTRYGLAPVGFGLTATAGTFAVGGAIMSRDLVQDGLGRRVVLAAILLGAGLSYLLASAQIATASALTFLIAETVEFAVYTPLRLRSRFGGARWVGTVIAANTAGAVLDTLLFLHLAGFPVTPRGVAGQLVGKAWVTVGVLAVGVVVRRAVPRHREFTADPVAHG